METITQTAAGMPVPGLSRAGNEIKLWGVKRNVHVDGGGMMGLARGISVN